MKVGRFREWVYNLNIGVLKQNTERNDLKI